MKKFAMDWDDMKLTCRIGGGQGIMPEMLILASISLAIGFVEAVKHYVVFVL